MLKAEYLGWSLYMVKKTNAGYTTCYDKEGEHSIWGIGHNPESACADAQKQIKKQAKGE